MVMQLLLPAAVGFGSWIGSQAPPMLCQPVENLEHLNEKKLLKRRQDLNKNTGKEPQNTYHSATLVMFLFT